MLLENKEILDKVDLELGRFGLEREALRITPSGKIAQTDHPPVFGDRTRNPYITTDFAEAQVEMITGVHDTVEEMHKELTLINQTVLRSIGDELLWPYSMPPVVDWNDVRIAEFPDCHTGSDARQYREYLAEKYGNGVQLVSGIHYNFSYSESLLQKLYGVNGKGRSFREFKNDLYMRVAKNYLNYHWLLVFMLGKAPIAEGIGEPEALSLRNSRYGYQNKEDLQLSYDSLCDHIASVRAAMEAGKIIDEREIYAPVRIKRRNQTKLLMDCLEENGIEYLEIRSIDLNPCAFAGITLQDLKFLHVFMLTLLALPTEVSFDAKALADEVALYGKEPSAEVLALKADFFEKMGELCEAFGLEGMMTAATNLPDVTVADFLTLAKRQKEEALASPYQSVGFEDMEMSTQLLIAESVRRGVKVKVIDRRANFLKLEGQGKVEYVKQATKTSLDTYVSFLAMENKEVTKIILEDAGFPVPAGRTFFSVDDAMRAFGDFVGREVVVKPKTTNFGWGIVMFRPLAGAAEFRDALEIAFGFDDEVIVEQFLHGQEYRFLVVGDACLAVLKRVGANVIGNGVSTVAELVATKNAHPWRGVDHLAPLEKIVLGEIELHNLKQAGLSVDSILAAGEQVFLRDNSNISTGGDSVDVTGDAHANFKAEAVRAAHAIGARLCGVDIVINGDLSDGDAEYGFIELNFNPAIHMHAFTYEGEGVNAAPYVLAELGLI
ncbi:MAG: bifunctional glutamate--cysteine ligase GshA/glutathione synthetase GshB [Turicibacter sp.]|nr:bifunctional glutamate--cysteine ligase GshA/glutathione synthetase GshB [Turicibacter sp.]